jgi:hypothetical protein
VLYLSATPNRTTSTAFPSSLIDANDARCVRTPADFPKLISKRSYYLMVYKKKLLSIVDKGESDRSDDMS